MNSIDEKGGKSELLCIICKTTIGDESMTEFAAYGGLPSPCCHVCFEVNNYSIKKP